MTETEQAVRELLSSHIQVLDADVELTSRLEDIGCDSIDRVELIYETEARFSITIPEDAAFEVETVADYIELVDSLRDAL